MPLVKRMEAADETGNSQEEGFQIALELAEKIKNYRDQGISGLHIMPVGWDEVVPRIVKELDLIPPQASISDTSVR